jgi:hypothetical protein
LDDGEQSPAQQQWRGEAKTTIGNKGGRPPHGRPPEASIKAAGSFVPEWDSDLHLARVNKDKLLAHWLRLLSPLNKLAVVVVVAGFAKALNLPVFYVSS